MAQDDERDIDQHVRRLLWSLQALPHDDRLGIGSEIHDHLTTSARRGAGALDQAMARLGAPAVLARSYVEDYELAGAVNRAAPAGLLMNLLGRGTRSLAAFGGGLAALFLYLFAASFALVAVAKLIVPAKVGAWHSAHAISAGITVPPAGTHELLGYWIVPIAIVLGALCFVGAGNCCDWSGGGC